MKKVQKNDENHFSLLEATTPINNSFFEKPYHDVSEHDVNEYVLKFY